MSLLSFLGDLWSNSDNRSVAKEDRERSLAELQKIMEEIRGGYGPYQGYGKQGGDALNAMLMGTGGSQAYDLYKKQMGYDTTFKAGVSAVDQSAANRGGLFSGKTGMDLARFGQDHEQKYLDSYMNRLFDQEKIGLTATGGMSGALSHYGDQVVDINRTEADNRMQANSNNSQAFHNWENEIGNAMARMFGGGGGF